MRVLNARIVVRVLFVTSLFLMIAAIAYSQPAAAGSTAAMRKCLESGRSYRVCFSETSNAAMFGDLTAPPTGPRMTGDYATAQGLRFIFQPDIVNTVCRGVLQKMPYTVELKETETVIHIGTSVVALRPDGKLSGTGSFRIIGDVVTGTHVENGVGYTPANEIVYTQTKVTEVATKTVDCNLGVMNVLGPTPLPPDIDNPFGYLGAIFSGMKALGQGKGTDGAMKEMLGIDKAAAPGLRMGGTYAGPTGFYVAFHPESATIGCGDAEQALEYSVKRTATQTLLTVQKPGGPIVLQLKPDGTITGTGQVQVDGRKIVNTTEDPDHPFVFAPVVGKCETGTLALGSTAPGVRTVTGAPNGGGSGGRGSTTTGSLSIATSFQGHPLVNKPILFFKQDLEVLLRKQGFQPVAGSPRSRAIDVYADACKAKDPKCAAADQAIAGQRVNLINTDAQGRIAASNIPPGDYWVVTEIGVNGHTYMWNMHVTVTAGQEIAMTLADMNTAVDW
jgi:hypothetical protein